MPKRDDIRAKNEQDRTSILSTVATLAPMISAIPFMVIAPKLGPTGPLIIVILLLLMQCIGFLITLIRGKSPERMLPGTKRLMWLNGIALCAYPLLLLVWIFALANAMNGINT